MEQDIRSLHDPLWFIEQLDSETLLNGWIRFHVVCEVRSNVSNSDQYGRLHFKIDFLPDADRTHVQGKIAELMLEAKRKNNPHLVPTQ